jgi:hypothetical protein
VGADERGRRSGKPLRQVAVVSIAIDDFKLT